MRRASLAAGRVNPFPPRRAAAIGRRWRQSRDVLPPTERIKFEWTTAVCSNGALVAFAVIIKSVLSYRRARGPRMDMKKRIHLELRNRTPSDVSPSLLASRPALAPRTRLMENLSVWWSCRGDFAKFARNLGDDAGGVRRVTPRVPCWWSAGSCRWNFCAVPASRWFVRIECGTAS